MRANPWRLAVACSCTAAAALFMFAGGASASSAASVARNFSAPFSITGSGAPLRGDPYPTYRASHQPRFFGNPALGSWTKVTNVPSGFFPGTMIQLMDGSVMIHEDNTGTWERLYPNAKSGSYLLGKWTSVAAMPSGYAPLYFASQVLSDGRLLIEGGEYNGSGTEVWTTLGAIYNPLSNTWTSVNPPSGWSNIGDAQSTLLDNGRFIMANIVNGQDALFSSSTLSWTTQAGTGKADRNDEEGYQKLASGQILTVNDEQALNNPSSPGSQVYNQVGGKWTSAGTLPSVLPSCQSNPCDEELGPMVYRPNGQVFAEGGQGTTAVYHGGTNWTAGPNEPNIGGSQYDAADAPAAPLPNGSVLMDLSPGLFNPPTHFFVYDGSTITQVSDTQNAGNDPSYVGRMMVLPTGQVMFDDGSGDLELFTPTGSANSGWKPTISSLSSTTLARSSSNTLNGTQLAGRTTGASYGDDAQEQTNYPLVRITNNATGQVTYARTNLPTTHSIKAGIASSVKFIVKNTTPTGPSTLVVVANGTASSPVAVTIT